MADDAEQPLVAVIGLGGVGSHCAHALVRAGIKRLRLVDFDRVSLSSLNRHAVGTRCDVGISKVVACAAHFTAIAPDCMAEACDEMFTAESAERLLGARYNSTSDLWETPSVVVDCIDDVNTKVDLLSACVQRGLHALSALGSGAKGDPTQLCVSRGLRDIENDPLATKLRAIFRTRGGDVSSISFVYSSEKPSKALLPLTEEQKTTPSEFGNVANFRLRVIPVLGSQPALAGIALASQVLVELHSPRPYHPRPSPAPKRALVERFLDNFRKRETARLGGRGSRIDLTVVEASFLLHEVWRGRSAFDSSLALASASGLKFTFAVWDYSQDATVSNVVFVTETEADAHMGPDQVQPELRLRIETALQWAGMKMALLPPSSLAQSCKASVLSRRSRYQRISNSSTNFTSYDSPYLLNRISNSEEEAVLIAEQLSRSAAFLGEAGHQRIRDAFVVIIGVGAVGSAAASLLLRAGVQHLRLVDGASVLPGATHAVSTMADVGRPKVEVCKRRLGAIRPNCHVEGMANNFNEETADKTFALADGRSPDLVLDCTGRVMEKARIVREGLSRGFNVVTAIAPSGLKDPTRLSVSALTEVHLSPAAVQLRLQLQATSVASKLGEVDAVHSQEDWQWVGAPAIESSAVGELMRLSLGVCTAAVALHRLAGEEVPRSSPSGMVGAWKKLDKGLKTRFKGEDNSLDLCGIGCIAEGIWRNRSALNRHSGDRGNLSGLCLTKWDRSLPISMYNVVMLTEEEAMSHDSLTSETGTLPIDLLHILNGKQAPHTIDAARASMLQTHNLLKQLENYLILDIHAPKPIDSWTYPEKSTVDPIFPAATLRGSQRDEISLPPGPTGAFVLAAAAAVCTSWRSFGKNASSSDRALQSIACILLGGLGTYLYSRRTQEVRDRLSSSLAVCDTMHGVGLGVAGLVGRTPLIELPSLSQATGCRIVAKAEFMNPGGCQKDRAARHIVDEAESHGLLRPGSTIVEGTSGSTGISLSIVAAARGYKVHIVVPDDQAAEKIAMLRRFGAEVELVRPASISSPEHYVNVARRRAKELNEQPGSKGAIFADQFENLANFRAHFSETGPELWQQCQHSLDAFVMSSGTGGTIAGVGSFLKNVAPKVQVCLADVPGSSLFSKVTSGVLYASEQAEQTVRRHRTDTIAEGIGLDRLTSNFAQGLCEHNGGNPIIDRGVRVSDQEALDMAHYVLAHEGIFIGSSAAVNCVGAVKIARKLGPGHLVATVLCDSGARHVTKFYNPEVWPAYGLTQPVARLRDDLSFVS